MVRTSRQCSILYRSSQPDRPSMQELYECVGSRENRGEVGRRGKSCMTRFAWGSFEGGAISLNATMGLGKETRLGCPRPIWLHLVLGLCVMLEFDRSRGASRQQPLRPEHDLRSSQAYIITIAVEEASRQSGNADDRCMSL
nr:hypothetical protein CFP56_78388 [Quercus suber]